MIQKLSEPSAATPLFAGWEEGMTWACLQERMGRYAPWSP